MSQKYTAEFKREAVRIMTEMGLSVPAVAGKPGDTASQLYAWRKKARLAGEDAFPGSGRLTPSRKKTDVSRRMSNVSNRSVTS